MRHKNRLIGVVHSRSGDKSVVVKVERMMLHPQYKKYIKRSQKFMAHDERNQCQVGDKVVIIESRPLSKQKHWRISKILERSKEVTP